MPDMLQALKDLDTTCKWSSGAFTVHAEALLVRAATLQFEKLKKDAHDLGSLLSYDQDKLKALMDGPGKALHAIAKDWRVQAEALFKAVHTDWPEIRNDARERYRKLIKLETAEGADSPAFARALKDTVSYIEGYRDEVSARETYCQTVAEQMTEMEAAHLKANPATVALAAAMEPAINSLEYLGSNQMKETRRDMIVLGNDIEGMPKALAGHYRRLADNVGKQAVAMKSERLATERALKQLYGMQGKKVLRDVKGYLNGLFKAA